METVKEQIEQIASGITLHWLNENRIAYFTIRTADRFSWSAWAKKMMDLKREWSIDRPFLTLHDSLYDGAAFTPTVRKHTTEVNNYRLELAQYTAIIMPKTPVAQFAQFFMRSHRVANRETQAFFTVGEGIDWLQSKL